MNITESTARRFWSKVEKGDSCWLWKADKRSGYGRFSIDDKKHQATHVAIMIKTGIEVPKGMEACHSCDNPACVNPDHLFIGTHRDNIHDAIAKGRLIDASKLKRRSGESHHTAKLKDKDIVPILNLISEGVSLSQIGAQFGVSKSTIFQVSNGNRWGAIHRQFHSERIIAKHEKKT